MPNLVAIDVSVTDNRIRLAFSDRAVAAAYAAHLRAQDGIQAIAGYQRRPQLHANAKEVSLSLPGFITWFITCRLPDDEDSVTLTFMDADARRAARWAAEMVLFEPVAGAVTGTTATALHNGDEPAAKQLQMRRLWNRTYLLTRLEELRREALAMASLEEEETEEETEVALPAVSQHRGTVGSPAWGNGLGLGGEEGYGGSGQGGVGGGGAAGRVPVQLPLTVMVPAAGRLPRGDIWW